MNLFMALETYQQELEMYMKAMERELGNGLLCRVVLCHFFLDS